MLYEVSMSSNKFGQDAFIEQKRLLALLHHSKWADVSKALFNKLHGT